MTVPLEDHIAFCLNSVLKSEDRSPNRLSLVLVKLLFASVRDVDRVIM
jgi:hypothetical protein